MTKLAIIDTETTGLDPDRHEIWEVALIVRETLDVEPGVLVEYADGEVVGRTEIPNPPRVVDTEYVWQLPVDLAKADLIALNIGRFHERRYPGNPYPISPFTMLDGRVSEIEREANDLALGTLPAGVSERARSVLDERNLEAWAARFADLTWGAHLVGAVPSFDEERLRKLLLAQGQCPGWHYHLCDTETLAVGYLRGFLDRDDERLPLAAPPWKSDELSRAIGVDPEEFDKHSALGDARWALAIYDAVMTKTR